MAFRNVVITQHSKVSYKMKMCVVQTENETYQIPVEDIQLLIIATTRVAITSYVVMELLNRGIRIIFTDDKGFPIGEVNSYLGNSNRNRNIQKQINWKQDKKDKLWQKIVELKIRNQANNLKQFNLESLPLFDLIDQINLSDKNNREAVAARMYFPRLFGKDFVRRDENQSINGLLNYGYSILLSAVTREISQNGYLTEIGVHHDSLENVFNLSSDLMEPFRTYFDACVFQMADKELNNQNKFELVKILDSTSTFNGKEMILSNAISEFTRNSLQFLSEEKGELQMEFIWGIELCD